MTPAEIADALADALSVLAEPLGVEVAARMVFAPGQAQIDIYPSEPAEGNLTFGPASRQHWWIVRMRTATGDEEGVQDALLAARAPTGPTSVRAALLTNDALDDLLDAITISDTSPTGFRFYADPSVSARTASTVRYVGQEWLVGTLVSEGVIS